MLEPLIKQLTESKLAFDGKSLTDAIWLAHVMKGASGESLDERPTDESDDERSKFTLTEDQQERAGTHKPAKPKEKVGQKNGHDADVDAEKQGSLKPVQNDPDSKRKAFLGALPALSDPAGFKRATKPFMAKARPVSTQLDERTTVERFIREGALILRPVLRSGSRRSLRLSLVIERAGSNSLWAQPLDELARLLGLQGTFRQLRQWSLRRGQPSETDGRSEAELYEAELYEIDRHGFERKRPQSAARMTWWPKEIVVIASDFTSDGWWNGEYPALLKRWSADQPVLLMHTLPRRLWSRCWTGLPDAWVSTPEPLVSGRTMQVRLDSNGHNAQRYDSGLALPIAELDPSAIGLWARALMGGGVRAPALLLESRERLHERPEAVTTAAPDATYLSTTFRMASSPPARKLAQHLSVAAPLSFPVMRWIQQALLPESDSSHLAEFVLGGLLVQVTQGSSERPDEVVYDFVEGVRPLLQQGMPITHGLEVQQSVGAYLEANHSERLDLRAVVDTATDEELSLLSPELRSFALVSRQFLERIGLRSPEAVSATPLLDETLAPAKGSDSSLTVRDMPRVEGLVADSSAPIEVSGPSEPGPLRIIGSTTSGQKRVLRERIVDLQWSSHGEETLATLTESGVDVWNPLSERNGKRVRWSTEQTPPRRPPLIVQWWIAEEKGLTDAVALAGGLARLIADALVADTSQSVRLRRVRDQMQLLDVGFNGGVLLVFETEKTEQWARTHPEQLRALESFRERPTVVLGVVQMGAERPLFRDVENRIGIRSPAEASASSRPYTTYGKLVGHLVRLMRGDLHRILKSFIEERRPTAISWLASGELAIAEYDGKSTTVRALDINRANRSGHTESTLISTHEGASGLLHIFPLPTSWSAEHRMSSYSDPSEPEMGCLDAEGNMSFMRRRYTDLVQGGNGLPRQPLFSSPSTMLGVTNDDSGILLFRNDVASGGGNVRLVPNDPRIGWRDPVTSLVRERVLAGWMRDDTVFTITASGFLHRGSEHDVFDARISEARSLDPEPKRLSDSLRAAAAAADGTRFAIITSSGVLELWDVDGDLPLVSWPLRRTTSLVSPRLALSANGRLIAYAIGRDVYIEEGPAAGIDLSHWTRRVLWVDDRPRNNREIRIAFAKEGVQCTLALSTDEALEKIGRRRFAVVISDMGREEGSSEGYVLLKALRDSGIKTPFFVFAGSNLPEHRDKAIARGAQGSTNDAGVLFQQVMQVIRREGGDSQ